MKVSAVIVAGLLGLALPGVVLGRGSAPLRQTSTIKPYTAPTITVDKPGSTPKASKSSSKSAGLSFFFHTWGTWVPGAVYDAGDWRWFSTGARGEAITIRANGTWSWHGLKGRWRKGDSEYPLVIVHGVDGHNWKVGTAPSYIHAQIILWDGFTYYYGKRAR